MNLEERRLLSYRRWPHPGESQGFQPTPLKLAKSGFYHAPTASFPDRVICFCCGIALVHWNKNHDPWTEHIKRSPTCGLITGGYAAYLSEEKRLASFKNWMLPPNYAATPSKLALSGFFSCPSPNFSDRCVCFCCGIALVRWEKDDDPWTEHVKHSKNCPFVRGKETGNIPILVDEPESHEESTLEKLYSKMDELDIDPSAFAPSYFLCPITQDIFVDPVFAEDGHTYERAAIKKWFEKHTTSPLTNKSLPSKKIITNHNLRAQLIEYAERLLQSGLKETNLDKSALVSSSSSQALHSSSPSSPSPAAAAAAAADQEASV